jgi:FkbM family methyltransferase
MRPEILVSYAQNHEDVVLARVLEPWNRVGHWIDIGAGHPTFDSVTRLFSDFGWTGINIEPLVPEFELLCADRPRDINLNCAIGDSAGVSLIYEGPPASRGTSTLIPEHAHSGHNDSDSIVTSEVEVKTLATVLEEAPWDIDLIKIDVEGMESAVIASADWTRVRAKVIVVEATLPNSVVPTHQLWESTLVAAGYSFRLFDGLNRFYSREDSAGDVDGIAVSKWYPACPQDKYIDQSVLLLKNAWDTNADGLRGAIRDLSTSMELAEEYARSLQDHLAARDASLVESTEYALSLEREIERLRSSLASNEVKRLEQLGKLRDLEQQVSSMRRRIEQVSR